MATSVSKELAAALHKASEADAFCAVGKAIKDHEAGDVIAEAVADVSRYSAAMLSRVLKQFDLVLSNSLILDHRRGTCRCR
jgi:hypothetical protein